MYAAEDTRRIATLDALQHLTRADMGRVDALIRQSLQSDVVLVSQVAEYIIGSGGKRLRPLLVLLGSRALAYDGDEHIRAAAIIEFIHTATLLHDDVVDASDRRRGRHTANHVFGNQASVLVGDFLYSRSFQMMVQIGDMQVMDILADATNTIAAGEVMQLMNVHDPDTTEERYLEVIHRKTAKLFEAGAAIAAVLSGQPPEVRERMAAYGRNLGAAFQLVDDALDYQASPDELGKDLGDDLAEGKPTLPLIHAMSAGTPEQRRLIRAAIENGGLDNLAPVQ
ncbi:MAG: octaprenyl diphosphate synthase, partial [Gammaproteobacteria bacterium]|nr:octaprenyl diphosphate synthase [Gammaproteobacteria bacterium]